MHVGVYGVVLSNRGILLVNKSRGPYKGLLDLPGGRPNPGESIEETLKREIIEEVGVIVVESSFLNNFATSTKYIDDKNDQKIFYHIAMVYKVDLFDQSNADLNIKEEDVDGSSWFAIDQIDLKKCSAPLREVLKFYEEKDSI